MKGSFRTPMLIEACCAALALALSPALAQEEPSDEAPASIESLIPAAQEALPAPTEYKYNPEPDGVEEFRPQMYMQNMQRQMQRTAAVAAPAAAPPAKGQQVYFPQLPPSSPCVKKDIAGLWRLVRVYENPVHNESQMYSVQPYQYLFFDWNDTYRQLKSSAVVEETGLISHFKTLGGDLQQFVVNDSGFVYLYTNSVATETWACFTVANQTPEFVMGQMLLMPPAGQSVVRLVKVYERVARVAPMEGEKVQQLPAEVREEMKRKRQEERRRRQRYQPATTVDNPRPEE
jgi:hypothetical protein